MKPGRKWRTLPRAALHTGSPTPCPRCGRITRPDRHGKFRRHHTIHEHAWCDGKIPK